MIDLHAHTTASDGTLSPRELVQHARDIGLSAVAVADHDTTSGWTEAFEAASELGIEVVPGIELSVEDRFGEHFGRFHLLGYYCSPDSELLKSEVPRLQDERDKRNREVLQVLAGQGMPVSYEELREIAGNQIGRPHIAQKMREKGYVSSLQEAFDLYLASGALAYRPKVVMKARDAVAAIREASGVAIWAHPPYDRKKLSWEQFDAVLQAWIAWGLDGLEAHYPTYSDEEAQWTHGAARRHGLIASGGSDFHGARKVNPLGECGRSGPVPDEVLRQIQELSRSR